jgi:hypothetical protein
LATVNIIRIERVIVAVHALEESRENWRRAGFAIAPVEFKRGGMRIARLAAGAVEIDLCELNDADDAGFFFFFFREITKNEVGIFCWV